MVDDELEAASDERFRLPEYTHDHPPVQNANHRWAALQGLGHRAADAVATAVGSWPFVLIQSIFLVGWIVVNITAAVKRWDPYPFILLNLVLSFQAAYTAPIIMMSQNRQAAKDRVKADLDFQVNVRGEEEIRVVLERLEATHAVVLELLRRQSLLESRLTTPQPK
ncbi:MAG: DUF1003 domain-containing protein [Methanocella sp.]